MPVFRPGKGKIIIVLCLFVIGYSIYTAGSGWVRNQRVDREQQAAEARVAELQATKSYLEGVRQYAASDAYVEQEARRQLGYIREGEISFVVTSPPLPEEEQRGPWWQRLFPK